MRFVIYGAGAVGGVIGARLHQAGHDVVLIARGAHFQAIRSSGLQLGCNDEYATLRVQVVSHPRDLQFTGDDVVLLAMKTQHTGEALHDLLAEAPSSLPIICAQNGVENERLALRVFENVYAMCVMCPTGHLQPGLVEAYASPITGLLDIGRYPHGTDGLASDIAAALATATFESIPRHDIMRWKYAKLLLNLGNAANALCAASPEVRQVSEHARVEAEGILTTCGIDFAVRRGGHRPARRSAQDSRLRRPAAGRIDVAEPRTGHWQRRDRLPQRGDRLAGPRARSHCAGQRDAAATLCAAGPRRPRRRFA